MLYGGRVEERHVPTWLDGLFDDSSAFPPVAVPIHEAVRTFRGLDGTSLASVAGRLVVPDVRLPDVIDALDDLDGDEEAGLPISVLVTGGAGAIEPAVRWATRSPVLDLGSVAVTLRNTDDLVESAQRVVAALGACDIDPTDVPVFAELPRTEDEPGHGWLGALDVLAAAEVGVKVRTASSAAAIAATIDAALDRELPLRAAAGAALVSTPGADVETGVLNLLRAVRGCLDGEDVVAVLTEQSVDALLADPDGLARARRWLPSVSVPGLHEIHDELVDLGLGRA